MTAYLAFFILFWFCRTSLSACSTDTQCATPTPACFVSSGSGTCVECTTNAHCSSSTNLCVANVCAACSSDNSCPSTAPRCVSSNCVQCLTGADCVASPILPACSSNHVCVECSANTDCTDVTLSTCSSSNTCEPCASSSDCLHILGLNACFSGVCSQCAVSSDCSSSSTPICDLGTCQPCSGDSQCEQISVSTPHCSPTGACAHCLNPTHCVDPNYSVCNIYSGSCENCASASDCTHLTATPYCSSGTCVQCIEDVGCSDLGKKCDPNSFTCVSQVPCILTVALKGSIDNGYKLSVGISAEACVDPTVNNILLTIQGLTQNVDFSYKTRKITSQNYEITLLALKSMDVAQLQTVVTYNAALSGNIELDPIIYTSETEQKIAKGIGSTSTGNLAILGFSTFAFALLGKLSTTWSFVAISQYISYLLYLNVRYPQQTKTYFRSIKGYGLLLPWKSDSDDDENLSELVNYQNAMPHRFYEEEYPVEFLHNTLQIFVLIFGSIFLLGVLKILFLHDKLKPLFLRKLLVSLRWNAIIRKICTYALPLCVAAFLQMHVAIFSNETNVFANIFAVLSILGLLVSLSKMTISISRIPNQRSKKIFYVGKYGTLWSGLSVQYNLGMYYNIIVTLRGILLGYLVVFQEVFGLLQLIPLMLYQVFVLAVFFKGFQRQLVFSDKDLNIFCAVQENLLMMLKVLIFLYYFLDDLMGVTDTAALSRLGWVIILPAFSVQLLQSLYSFYLMYRERKVLYVKLQKIGRKIFCIKPKWSKKIERTRKSTSVSTIQSESLEFSPA